jgi:hypothetical protein
MWKCSVPDLHYKSHCPYFFVGSCTAKKLGKKCGYKKEIKESKNG